MGEGQMGQNQLNSLCKGEGVANLKLIRASYVERGQIRGRETMKSAAVSCFAPQRARN